MEVNGAEGGDECETPFRDELPKSDSPETVQYCNCNTASGKGLGFKRSFCSLVFEKNVRLL